jgi:hypothetical protein
MTVTRRISQTPKFERDEIVDNITAARERMNYWIDRLTEYDAKYAQSRYRMEVGAVSTPSSTASPSSDSWRKASFDHEQY